VFLCLGPLAGPAAARPGWRGLPLLARWAHNVRPPWPSRVVLVTFAACPDRGVPSWLWVVGDPRNKAGTRAARCLLAPGEAGLAAWPVPGHPAVNPTLCCRLARAAHQLSAAGLSYRDIALGRLAAMLGDESIHARRQLLQRPASARRLWSWL